MTKQNTTFVLKLIVNILVLRFFCDSSNCPARAGGLGAQGGSGQGALGQDEEGKGTVAVTVSSHIPGQIHRTFTRMRTGQGHLGG